MSIITTITDYLGRAQRVRDAVATIEPVLDSLIARAEAALGPGNGAAKLETVRQALAKGWDEAGKAVDLFNEAWPSIQTLIAGAVLIGKLVKPAGAKS